MVTVTNPGWLGQTSRGFTSVSQSRGSKDAGSGGVDESQLAPGVADRDMPDWATASDDVILSSPQDKIAASVDILRMTCPDGQKNPRLQRSITWSSFTPQRSKNIVNAQAAWRYWPRSAGPRPL